MLRRRWSSPPLPLAAIAAIRALPCPASDRIPTRDLGSRELPAPAPAQGWTAGWVLRWAPPPSALAASLAPRSFSALTLALRYANAVLAAILHDDGRIRIVKSIVRLPLVRDVPQPAPGDCLFLFPTRSCSFWSICLPLLLLACLVVLFARGMASVRACVRAKLAPLRLGLLRTSPTLPTPYLELLWQHGPYGT